MDRTDTLTLLARYYAAFNAGDWQGMLRLPCQRCGA